MATHTVASPKTIERNLAARVGVLPGVSGTFIAVSSGTAGGTATLYTVPADKTLLIYNTYCNLYATVSGHGKMSIYDATPVEVYEIHGGDIIGGTTSTAGSLARFLALEVPEDYSIRVVGSANVNVYGGFEGILMSTP